MSAALLDACVGILFKGAGIVLLFSVVLWLAKHCFGDLPS